MIEVIVGSIDEVSIEVSCDNVAVDVASSIVVVHDNYYAGPYSATPTREQQVIHVEEKYMRQDFVVEPIPQNYGLITYNGFEITVS